MRSSAPGKIDAPAWINCCVQILNVSQHTKRAHNYRCTASYQLSVATRFSSPLGAKGQNLHSLRCGTNATPPPRPRKRNPAKMNDNAKIGTALLGLGCLFIVLGVIFFFDRMFLSLGNVMFLGGLLLTMGVSRSQRFFVKKAKDSGFRGVGCFFGGVILVVFFKRPLLGMCLEGFGFVNLFANFFPIALSAMRSMPVLGDVLAMPGVSAIADKLAGVEPRRAQRSWA